MELRQNLWGASQGTSLRVATRHGTAFALVQMVRHLVRVLVGQCDFCHAQRLFQDLFSEHIPQLRDKTFCEWRWPYNKAITMSLILVVQDKCSLQEEAWLQLEMQVRSFNGSLWRESSHHTQPVPCSGRSQIVGRLSHLLWLSPNCTSQKYLQSIRKTIV